jgi:hypothetical protein
MKNQFHALQNWTREVLHSIKKDIKTDHLPTDPIFYKTYFGNRPQNRLTSEEIFSAYEQELLKGNQELADWVVNRWVFKHADLYQHFAERLSEVNPDFDQITQLNETEGEQILAGANESFGAIPVFLFSLLNGVVFPESTLNRLRQEAEKEKATLEKSKASDIEQESLEKILAAHKREIARQNDKILGAQKKYERDTEALKKQIKILQQKLNATVSR